MPLVKIYKYKIKPGAEELYLELQVQVQSIYRRYGEIEFTYLKDAQNSLLRTEMIHVYGVDCADVLRKIDLDPDIARLFQEFKNQVLDLSLPIHEETLVDEKISATGKLHHIEIYFSDLSKSTQFWSWFLSELGYKEYQKWPQGISYKLGHSYLVFVQVEEKHLDSKYHRCKPGLNHLAFYASDAKQIEQLTVKLREKGLRILYEDRHPHAGGNAYGVYFEDPERIKVEVVAP